MTKEKVYSFPRGGITFKDPSVPSRSSLVTAFLPSISIIPMIQHCGRRAHPVVSVGEMVKEGALVGKGVGPGSANVHASVPGRVIRLVSWKSAGEQVLDGLMIRMEGSFSKLGKQEELFPWEGMLPYDIQRTIADYGVVEMEGGGRPVSELISFFRSAPEPITLVVSCIFDDPWLAADYVLCKERAAAITEGAAITARTCRVSRIVYAISHTEKELGKLFLDTAGKWGIPAVIALVGSKYPQRNQREMELVLRNFGKKENIDLGSMFVLGPATLAAVYDAVKARKPVLERYVAVGGSAIKEPQVMKVRIGKRIGDLFSECGGFKGIPKRIAAGSPLMGKPFVDLDEPVTKTTNAVFAMHEGFRQEANGICISCGECRNVCPVGLDPEELYKKAIVSRKEAYSANRAGECHGCGCCEVVCPSMLPLSTVIISYAARGNQ